MSEPRPVRSLPSAEDDSERYVLWSRVQAALAMLPTAFAAKVRVTGANPEDLFSFNTAVGTTIERELVRCMNHELRHIWDPDGRYAGESFERQGQTFPDALLRRPGESGRRLGLELKGWYVLSREREPSFRYTTHPSKCEPWDLLVVVPWVLDEIVRGRPVVLAPYVEQARYAAQTSQWFWKYGRKSKSAETGFKDVDLGEGSLVTAKGRSAAHAKEDDGKNSGRLARCGVPEFDSWLASTLAEERGGLPLRILQRAFEINKKSRTMHIQDGSWERLLLEVAPDNRDRARSALEALREQPEWDY